MGRRRSRGAALPECGAEMYAALLQMQKTETEDDAEACECLFRRLPSLLPTIVSDMVSSDEEIASLALRCLGYLTHHPKIVVEISDERAISLLTCLSKLIISTDLKAVCNLGVWCLGIQQFKVHLLDSHCEMILQAIIHAIENPMGSFSVTFEAFQVVLILVQKLPLKMKSLSTIWAPPVYKRLLSSVRIEREIAERCLKEVESLLLPPQALVAKIVALDIKEALLWKMEKMVKTEALMVPTIQAWGWLIRLLGDTVGENRALLNQMLKIVEFTFISQDTQVRIATLVAWEALIEALLPNQAEAELTLKTSPQPPSIKRLKLLMIPLTNIITNDNDSSLHHACWRIWSQLACKLGSHINNPSVLESVVAPMFDAVFSSGPQKCDPWVWDLCLTVFEDSVGCKLGNPLDFNYQANSLQISGLDGSTLSPKTPSSSIGNSGKESIPEIKLNTSINWESWGPSKLAFILKTLRKLWLCSSTNLHKSDNGSVSLNGALRIWWLVVKGVTSFGSGMIEPPEYHIESIHTLLHFFGELCDPKEIMAGHGKEVSSVVWSFAEVLLIELRPLILSSSFYKLPAPFSNLDKNHCDSHFEGFFKLGDLVTPIVYLASSWLHYVFELSWDGEEGRTLERIEKLAVASCAGLDVIGNFQGHLCSLYHISYASSRVMKHKKLSVDIWRTLTMHLSLYLEDLNDVPTLRTSLGDTLTGYRVICNFLLYPLQFFLSNGQATKRLEEARVLLELSSKTWIRLYDSTLRISSQKNGHPNYFASSISTKILKLLHVEESLKNEGSHNDDPLMNHGFLDLLTDVVVNILKQTEISSLTLLAMNRKKRLGSFMSSSGASGVVGADLDDSSNIRDIISLASRFLGLAPEFFCIDKASASIPSRVLASLTGFVSRIQLQNDLLLFLQVMVKPLSEWLNCDEEKFGPLLLTVLGPLEKLWDTILGCLQRCHPPLTFDSNLLATQAPLLAPALHHYPNPIGDATIAFWEATYGSKPYLTYPFSLISVLTRLRQKVAISLPSFDQRVEDSAGPTLTYAAIGGRRKHRMLHDETGKSLSICPIVAKLGDSSPQENGGVGDQLKLDLSPSPSGTTSVMGKSVSNSEMEREREREGEKEAFNVRNYTMRSLSNPKQVSEVKPPRTVDQKCIAHNGESSSIADTSMDANQKRIASDETLHGSEITKQMGGRDIENYLAAVAGRRKKLKFMEEDNTTTTEYSTFPCSQRKSITMTKPLKEECKVESGRHSTRFGKEEEEEEKEKVKAEVRLSRMGTCTAIVSSKARRRRRSEVANLGVYRRRFLRSSGCLRGGKHWRIPLEAAGGRSALQQRKLSRKPIECTSMQVEPSSRQFEESPFRVRTLSRGYLAQLFSSLCNGESLKVKPCPEQGLPHRHRKNSLPKKAPLPAASNGENTLLVEGFKDRISHLKGLKSEEQTREPSPGTEAAVESLNAERGNLNSDKVCDSLKENGGNSVNPSIEGKSRLSNGTVSCGGTQVIREVTLEDGKQICENQIRGKFVFDRNEMDDLLNGLGSIVYHPYWKYAETKDLITAEVLLSALSDRLEKYKCNL